MDSTSSLAVSTAFAPPAQAVLTGGEAIARGMYHGVAQLADSTYWKNKALGIVEAVKFIGSLLAEDVWLENWETEYHTATVTGNQETCDQLLEHFEQHEFQSLSVAEQGIRQTCIQLQTLSWDQLLEHGAQLVTSLALDCVILKGGEFALSEGRAFMHDIIKVFKLPPPHAQEYMIELAGIGKIALEESSDITHQVLETLKKAPEIINSENEIIENFRKLAKFKNKSHWEFLAMDPDHSHRISLKSIEEAIAGIVAEEKGFLPGPIRRDASGAAEFIDALGKAWDVKTPISVAPNLKYVFNKELIFKSIKRELDLGENVILNMIKLKKEDALALVKKLKNDLSADEIKKIITIFHEDLF